MSMAALNVVKLVEGWCEMMKYKSTADRQSLKSAKPAAAKASAVRLQKAFTQDLNRAQAQKAHSALMQGLNRAKQNYGAASSMPKVSKPYAQSSGRMAEGASPQQKQMYTAVQGRPPAPLKNGGVTKSGGKTVKMMGGGKC